MYRQMTPSPRADWIQKEGRRKERAGWRAGWREGMEGG